MARSPFQFPTNVTPLPTLAKALQDALKRPPIGLTQGGSSRRKDRGAKIAATNGQVRAQK